MNNLVKVQTRLSRRQLLTLLGVGAAAVMITVDVTVVGVALDNIRQSLHANFAELEWVANAYALTFTSFVLTAGALADLFGRRRIFALGIGVFTACSLLCGLSPSPWMLTLFRALQGVGGALVFNSIPAVLAHEFRSTARATAFGFLGSAFGIGFAIGPIVGGALTSGLSWRWIFFVNVPIGLGILALAVPRMSSSGAPNTKHVDWAGLVTFTLSLFLFTFALIGGTESGWGSPQTVSALLGAGVLLALFILAERWQQHPMFDLALFGNSTFVANSLAAMVVSFSMISLLYYIPLYFQSVNGYSPLQAGLTMLPFTLCLLAVPSISGKLAARLPARVLLSAGLVLIGFGELWMREIQAGASWTALLGGLFVAGVGAGLCNGQLDNIAVSVASDKRRGTAVGMFNTIRLCGDILAIAGSGAILISAIKFRLPDLIWGTPAASSGQDTNLANLVARGDISGAAARVPAAGHAVFIHAANQSYTSALQKVLLVLACVCFAVAVLTIAQVRTHNMSEPPVSDR